MLRTSGLSRRACQRRVRFPRRRAAACRHRSPATDALARIGLQDEQDQVLHIGPDRSSRSARIRRSIESSDSRSSAPPRRSGRSPLRLQHREAALLLETSGSTPLDHAERDAIVKPSIVTASVLGSARMLTPDSFMVMRISGEADGHAGTRPAHHHRRTATAGSVTVSDEAALARQVVEQSRLA